MFSLDWKRRKRKRNRKKKKLFWSFWLRFRQASDSASDSDFWFTLDRNAPCASDSDSASDSVASVNQPLMCNAHALLDCMLPIIEPTVDYGFHKIREFRNFSLWSSHKIHRQPKLSLWGVIIKKKKIFMRMFSSWNKLSWHSYRCHLLLHNDLTRNLTLAFQHVEVLCYNSFNLQRFVWGKTLKDILAEIVIFFQ